MAILNLRLPIVIAVLIPVVITRFLLNDARLLRRFASELLRAGNNPVTPRILSWQTSYSQRPLRRRSTFYDREL